MNCLAPEFRSSKTHCQAYAIARGVIAEHIARHQSGAGDKDRVFTAVQLEANPQGGQTGKAQRPSLLAEKFSMRPLQHITQRVAQQRPVGYRRAAAQIQAEILRAGLALYHLGALPKLCRCI